MDKKKIVKSGVIRSTHKYTSPDKNSELNRSEITRTIACNSLIYLKNIRGTKDDADHVGSM